MANPASSPPDPAAPRDSAPGALRIASYNVHACVGSDGRADAARVAAVIRELGCDTIGLQEVSRLGELARGSGLAAIEGHPHMWHDRHVGNALLTSRRVLEVRHHEFGLPDCEPRAALDVDLDVSGEKVRVIVTHLGLPPAERRYQVRQLLSLIKNTPLHEPVVVLGDINEWLPLGRPLRWMHALLGRSPAERSFPSRWPLFALDRVWVRPRHSLLGFEAHRSPLAAVASDHLPVKAAISVVRTATACSAAYKVSSAARAG